MKFPRVLSAIFFSIILLFLSSCLKDEEGRTSQDEINELSEYLTTNNINAIPTWTGLYLFEDSVGTGVQPEYYDTVVIDYHASLLDGTFLVSSENAGEPFTFNLGDWDIISGLSEAIGYLKMGSKARAIIPSVLAYGSYSSGAIVPYSTLVYEFELLEVRPGNPIEPYSTEDSLLNTTSSGLQYYIEERNDGYLLRSGNTVSVHYTGYFLDGTVFDSSVKRGSPVDMTIGVGKLIAGFDEGLLLMKVGEKFRFIIPAELAYKDQGNFPVIPPNSTITFDVEVLGIKL